MPDVRMPQLGESVTEGTLGKWLKQVGDKITKYEPLVEVITDKVTAEIPADGDGILVQIIVPEGETVSVGTKIAVISESTEQTTENAMVVSAANDAEAMKHTMSIGRESTKENIDTEKAGRFSPVVMRLLQEHHVDPKNVIGSGMGGRITRKDVYLYLENLPNQQATENMIKKVETETKRTAVSKAIKGNVEVPTEQTELSVERSETLSAKDQILPASTIRKTIAKRMVESKHTAPHAWTMVEADVTSLVKFRTKVKAEFKQREGIDLTYLPFFIKAVTEALKEFPMMNSSWSNDEIVIKKDINISIAVATDDALVVPVIHHADRLSITGIAHAIHDLATRTRTGKLTIDDIKGGTFTVNNTGAFGSILSAPIINSPQAAILTMEAIVKRPMVLDHDAIAIRSMVNLCLSLDHRVLDGLICGRFLKNIKDRLQEFKEHTIL